jgi:hypothetical protein
MSNYGAVCTKLIADLTYISYRHNRQIAPDVSAERWAKIYADAKFLEARYQTELKG